MKVWLVHDLDHYEVSVYDGCTKITNVPLVRTELGYLDGAYEDEKAEFLADVDRAVHRGTGSATIEERVRVELVNVRETI